jgi:hypothetical protein
LYVILDIDSRCIVGWMTRKRVPPERECQNLALCLIEGTRAKHGIVAGPLTLHADRGSSMTSKGVALLQHGLPRGTGELYSVLAGGHHVPRARHLVLTGHTGPSRPNQALQRTGQEPGRLVGRLACPPLNLAVVLLQIVI